MIYKYLTDIASWHWKLKPIKGFRFLRKGDPFSTSPMKHGGG
jgi:hypothetical protein